MNNSASNRVIVTDDGAVRYYWRAWLPALFYGTVGLFFIWMGVFMTGDSDTLCFSILFLPGLPLSYYGIGKAINYTEFRFEGGDLFVRHKPLPWRGNLAIPTLEISHIDVKKIDKINYDEYGNAAHNVKYQVAAVHGDRLLPLISVSDLDIADAIARKVGNFLGKPRQIYAEKRISALKESLSNDKAEQIRKTVFHPSTPYLLLLFFLTGIFLTFAGVNNVREWRASQSWPSVTGKVVEAQIVEVRDESDGNVYFSYTLKITYQYSVNDKIYTSDRISFIGQPSYLSENLAQQAFRNIAPDRRVIVYYDRADPNRAVLERQTFYDTGIVIGIFFLVPSTIGVLVIIWFRRKYPRKTRKKHPRGDLPSRFDNP